MDWPWPYGVVYAAHDPVLAREIAIKIIRSRGRPVSNANRSKFLHQRVGRRVSAIPHRDDYDAGKTDASAYIAMERLHGEDLHQYLASVTVSVRARPQPTMMRVADAIDYANKRGLVHRDIKPSNIFFRAT